MVLRFFPVVVVIEAAVGVDLVGVSDDEAAGCPESNLASAAKSTVPVCS